MPSSTKLPDRPPPLDVIRTSEPSWVLFPAGTLFWRVFPRVGGFPSAWNRLRTWGPTSARFDHHLAGPDGGGVEQARGILYAASEIHTCLAEFFQATRVIDRTRDQVTLAAFALVRPIRLLDLWSPWVTRLGASGALSSDPTRATTRAWARALYDTFPDADGLRYESSMHPATAAFALWERAADALPAHPRFHRALQDPELSVVLLNAARRLHYKLVP